MPKEMNAYDQYLGQLAAGGNPEEPSHEHLREHMKSSSITALAHGVHDQTLAPSITTGEFETSQEREPVSIGSQSRRSESKAG